MLFPKGDIYFNSTQGSGNMWKRNQKEHKSRKLGRSVLLTAIFGASNGFCTRELTSAIFIFTRPAQTRKADEMSQHSNRQC